MGYKKFFLLKINIAPEIADRKLCFGYFVIPSQTLRISSGLRLRTASAPFLVILSDSEESQQETLRLRLRVTSKKR